MANVGDAIFDLLSNDADVSSVVSSRIFPLEIPQGEAFPAVTYTYITNTPTDVKNNVSKMDTIQVDIDIWNGGTSSVYRDSVDLALKIRTALDRYSGTKSSVNINSIQFTGQREDPGNNEQEVHITQTYNVREKL